MKRAPYQLTLQSNVSDIRPTFRFHTADGVCSKHDFRRAELLLVNELWDTDLGRLLTVEANYGVVGIVLADRATEACMAESSARAVQLCARNARENHVDVSTTLIADVTTLDGHFDTVAYAPKPDTSLEIAQQRLVDGLAVLRSEGRLYVSASRATGLTRYERTLGEIGVSVERIAESGGYSLLKATAPPGFQPPTYVSPRALNPVVNGTTLSLISVDGLFSSSRLDDGTRLLLETASFTDACRVLDICCGHGAIGTYAGRTADCEVWLSDDDCVATTCAECSLEASGVDATVVTADCAEGVSEQTFDTVVCNPPTHAGNGVLSELFYGIQDILAPDGSLWLVHHRALDLGSHLSAFDTDRCHRRTGEYVVLHGSP